MSLRLPHDETRASIGLHGSLGIARTVAAHGIGVLILVGFVGAYLSWASVSAEKKRVRMAESQATMFQEVSFP